MGGGSKSESGSAQKWAQPIAQSAANNATGVYNAAQPGLEALTAQTQAMMPNLQKQYDATAASNMALSNAFSGMLPSLSNAANNTYAGNQGLASQASGLASGLFGQVGGPNAASAAMPYAARQLGSGNALGGVSGLLGSLIPGQAFASGHNDNLDAAQGYSKDVLGGKYLQGNPYLQNIIDQTNRSVTNGVNSQFEMSGRYGAGAHSGTLGQALADSEGNLRYNDYNNQMGRMDAMAGLAPSLTGAQTALGNNGINNTINLAGAIGQNEQARSGINTNSLNNYLNTANTASSLNNTTYNQAMGAAQAGSQLDAASYQGLNPLFQASGMIPQFNQASYSGLPEILNTASVGAGLPYTGMQAYNNSLGTLFNGGTQQTSNGLLGGVGTALGGLAGGIGSAGGVTKFFSDRRLKRDIEKVGELEDGLGLYTWRYVWGDNRHQGVMADEVAALRPWALGPTVAGYATVDYSKIEAR